MDVKTIGLLLENLVDRIEFDDGLGKWRVGVISSLEKDAILGAATYLRSREGDEEIVFAESAPVSNPSSGSGLNLDSLAEGSGSASDIILCLDFGTAMSKAFAMYDNGRPIEIALGESAGTSGYLVDSSVFISDNGFINFGPRAVSESYVAGESGRSRFDSPKSRLNMGIQADIDTVPVNKDINPTGIAISEGELITLYLGYLTDLATSTLESKGLGRYPLRRFARPCWDKAREQWAEPLMRKMMAKAQILADTFHGRWSAGLPIEDAKAALKAIASLEKLPDHLVLPAGVPEPIAAAGSLIVRDEGQREVFMVVDVGAGTTDFGLFLLQHNPHREICKVHEIPGTVKNLRQAGDIVDALLKNFILKGVGIDSTDNNHGKHVAADLQGRIRFYKETLFRDRSVSIELSNQTSLQVDLSEFLEDPKISAFAGVLAAKFIDSIGEIENLTGPSQSLILDVMADRGLRVVLTGGGATLPMVSALANGFIEIKGRIIQRKPADLVPKWISENYQQFESQYPQLAVAIGGASPDLPGAGDSFYIKG